MRPVVGAGGEASWVPLEPTSMRQLLIAFAKTLDPVLFLFLFYFFLLFPVFPGMLEERRAADGANPGLDVSYKYATSHLPNIYLIRTCSFGSPFIPSCMGVNQVMPYNKRRILPHKKS